MASQAPGSERMTSSSLSPDSTSQPAQHSVKSQRVLACVRCQQRKVKCDRRFPCAHCKRAQVQCIPSTLAQRRRRRRRFPESDLLERVQKYEELLRQNNITFEPLLKDSAKDKRSPRDDEQDSDDDHQDDEEPESSNRSARTDPEKTAKNVWHLMSQAFREPDNRSESSDDVFRESTARVWMKYLGDHDHLLFLARTAPVDLSTLHPEPVQIFRLWQIYLDNVDPLLKVTHTPTLQGRILEAAGNITGLDFTLEALMFSIYCTAILSLFPDECLSMFGSTRDELMMRYQFGCREALLNCGFLKNIDRDRLTALYLYLISVKISALPESVCYIMGVAMRAAQRLGINSEASLAKCSTLEAEMRRRLWWSLTFFDHRVAELATFRGAMMTPAWDCRIPMNINDAELRSEMKARPIEQGKCTEALFVVARAELGEYVRNSKYHLDFNEPGLQPLARVFQNPAATDEAELKKLEDRLENQYFKHCNAENPIQFMTMWTMRTQVAKCRLMEHHARYADTEGTHTDAQRNQATEYALQMLECDTKVMTSPLTKGFRWLNNFYFPFPAYIQLFQDLKRRPYGELSERAWEVMSDNHDAWFECQNGQFSDGHPFYTMISRIIMGAWEARKAAGASLGHPVPTPKLVTTIYKIEANDPGNTDVTDPNHMALNMDFGAFAFPGIAPSGFPDLTSPPGMGIQDNTAALKRDMFAMSLQQLPVETTMNPMDWSMSGEQQDWQGW